MKKSKLLIGFILTFGFTATAVAGVCNTESTNQVVAEHVGEGSHYTVYPTTGGNGQFILDSNTGLVWMRCSVGQSWDASTQTCQGNAVRLNWQRALAYAQEAAGVDPAIVAAADLGLSLRLPTIKELVSIVDYQCFMPPFNPGVFPGTPASLVHGFWSSTPLQTIAKDLETTYAWYIDGKDGGSNTAVISQTSLDPKLQTLHFVRLLANQP